ncbi:glycosyltransferase [bacterium]|nr:glycosyltransferase [bacterium]
MTFQPKISIVTIVYNGVATLEKTIQSISNQTYSNIEYIIVDGGSNDGTVDLINSYSSSIAKWVSEDDDGLYDAMNKGLKMSTGDYIWFINSGDEIASKTTIDEFIKNSPQSDIYYGETVIVNESGEEIGGRRLQAPNNLTWKSFKKGMLVSHQSFIASTKIASNYNLQYKFSADYEWCLLALKKAKTITNTHQVLSRFLDGGVTKQNIVPGLIERFKIMKQQFGLLPTLLLHIPIGYKFLLFVIKNKRF